MVTSAQPGLRSQFDALLQKLLFLYLSHKILSREIKQLEISTGELPLNLITTDDHCILWFMELLRESQSLHIT